MAFVKLASNWFAPSEAVVKDNRNILQASGRQYDKSVSGSVIMLDGRTEPSGNNQGWTEIPDELLHLVPKGTIIKEDDYKSVVKVEKVPQLSFKDFDNERAASDALVKANENAEKNKK